MHHPEQQELLPTVSPIAFFPAVTAASASASAPSAFHQVETMALAARAEPLHIFAHLTRARRHSVPNGVGGAWHLVAERDLLRQMKEGTGRDRRSDGSREDSFSRDGVSGSRAELRPGRAFDGEREGLTITLPYRRKTRLCSNASSAMRRSHINHKLSRIAGWAVPLHYGECKWDGGRDYSL
ncbi:hypothetical protein F5148DRAFT_135954 [Russula earlei]|uniref:Uncharacterized protein n=1 Tax=Russula earlei TaxID=71964 RepID=A0ACC0TRH2_9AGAM|nr:hypothetical protein F5148DRAFT_135954 [Russula earlei]